MEALNNGHPNVNSTEKASQKSVPFLDLDINLS